MQGRGFESHLGLGFFLVPNEFMINISFHVYIILIFAHLGGWLAASQICFTVTARCSYELCCPSLFDFVAA